MRKIDDITILGEIYLSSRYKIRVAIQMYEGKEKLDIRHMAKPKYGQFPPNYWSYTTNGIQIPIEQWEEFYRAILRLKKFL